MTRSISGPLILGNFHIGNTMEWHVAGFWGSLGPQGSGGARRAFSQQEEGGRGPGDQSLRAPERCARVPDSQTHRLHKKR